MRRFCRADALLPELQPLAFIEGFEKMERDFPNHGVGFHPPDAVRKQIVPGIIPIKILLAKPKLSSNLQIFKHSKTSANGNNIKRIDEMTCVIAVDLNAKVELLQSRYA